jgi:hypothetical protein
VVDAPNAERNSFAQVAQNQTSRPARSISAILVLPLSWPATLRAGEGVKQEDMQGVNLQPNTVSCSGCTARNPSASLHAR